MAAYLVYLMGNEAAYLDSKVNPFTMSLEDELLHDWLYVEDNSNYRADLQQWSESRTMLADTPDYNYDPEWTMYIKWPFHD